jgi:hypothetical protein
VSKPPPSVIQDAIIETPADLELMRGIREVEGTFAIFGVNSTQGLEALETVGHLELSYMSFDEGAPSVLAGLSNLKQIHGNLIALYSRFPTIELHPELMVEGDVTFKLSPNTTSCETIAAFQTKLRANGFDGCFASSCGGDDCAETCVDGKCVAVPPP